MVFRGRMSKRSFFPTLFDDLVLKWFLKLWQNRKCLIFVVQLWYSKKGMEISSLSMIKHEILEQFKFPAQIWGFKYSPKIHSFLKQCFSFYENKVLQLMSVGASLERLCESTMLTIPPCLYPILLLSLILCMFLVHSGKRRHQRVGNTVYSRKTKSSWICSNLWCWSNIWSINVALCWVISIWWGFKKYLYWVQNGPK